MSNKGTFGYSLTGDRYTGTFATRGEALSAAFEAARNAIDAPQTVFVGRWAAPNPRATGHAREIIASMGERARGEFGDGANYLKHVASEQITTLDRALETTILEWLTSNNLMPAATKMEAIGEYPVTSSGTDRSTNEQREVHEIGLE